MLQVFRFSSPVFRCQCTNYVLCGRPLRTLQPLSKGPCGFTANNGCFLLRGKKVLYGVHIFFSREKRKAGERGELLACCVQLSSCFQLYEWCLACVFSRVNVKGRLLVFFYMQTLSRGGRPVIVQNDHAGTALPPSECALELAVQGRLLNLSATCSNQISTARSSGKPSPPRQSYS